MFSSHLIGAYKLSEEFRSVLRQRYRDGHRSIRQVKRHLTSVCRWSEDVSLRIEFSETDPISMPSMEARLMEDRLRWLTGPQLDLLKVIMFHCNLKRCLDFIVKEIHDTAIKYNSRISITRRDIAYLSTTNFIQPVKDSVISENSKFTIQTPPQYFNSLLEKNSEFHRERTDKFWKYIN